MIGAIGSRCLFQLRVLVLLSQAGEIVESEKDDNSLKTCHDREARKMAEQRTVRKNKIPMATASRGRLRPELTRHVNKFSAPRKVEKDLCGDGRSGNHCERKSKYVEKKLEGKCEKRNGSVKNG